MAFRLCSSLDPAEAVFVVASDLTRKFVEELAKAAELPVHAIPNDPAHRTDIWIQDAVEFGVELDESGRPSPAALAGIRGRHDQGLTCGPLDEGIGYYLKSNLPDVKLLRPAESLPSRRWIDWYGNLECTPPLPGYPHGRVLVGKQRELAMHPDILKFLEEQKIQWPPIEIDVSWLMIGHVDEAISFVHGPEGFAVLIPDPQKAVKILEGRPLNEKVFVGRREETTVSELLEAGNSYEQMEVVRTLDRIKEQLCRELEIPLSRIHGLPLLFEGREALWPNPVNSLVLGGRFLVSDPHYAPFKESIGDVLTQLGNQAIFLDAWEPYHVRGGEIHCGTNALRLPAKG
jgi:protein-arginine deiminase